MRNIYHNDTKWGQEEFEAELKKGHKFQAIVRDRLINCGFEVEMPELDTNRGTDDGDIFVHINGVRFVIEVKSSRFEFNSIKEFPYDPVMVDMQENYRKKGHLVTAYINISQVTGYMFVIPCSTKEYWTEKPVKDKVRGYTKYFIFAEKKHLKEFDDLVQWLKTK